MTTHALLSASGSARWSRCAGSVALERGLPDQTSPYAAEGTAAHLLAAKALEAGVDVAMFLGAHLEVPQDDGTKKVYVVDQSMMEHVKTYVDAVRTYGSVEGASLYVEQHVDFSDVIGVPDSFGTGDAIVVVPSRREIQAHDLKFGMGVEVDAFEIATEQLVRYDMSIDDFEVLFNVGDEIPNSQLALYALGALEAHSLYADFDEVLLVIHQPRRGHLSEWRCSVETLRKFGKWLRTRAKIAVAEWAKDKLTPGKKQCMWCKAKATCPALRATVMEATAADFDDLTTMADAAEGDLSELMAKVDLIEDWCKAVRARTEISLLQGTAVPGWKLVEGKKGNRKWSDAKATEEFLRKARLSKKQIYETSLISPASAEKLLKPRARLWTALQSQISQSPGKLSVAPESDRRPAAQPGASADDFTTITGE